MDAQHDILTMSNSNRLKVETGSPEWYTPSSIINPVRKVLGEIDLDPASCALANEVVKAKKYYDIHDDGLRQEWEGRVFLNPPYGRTLIGPWVTKLMASEKVNRWICLTNNATETNWARILMRYSSHILFPGFRIKFWNPKFANNSPTQGQMICFSRNINFFDIKEAFYDHGFIFSNQTFRSKNDFEGGFL